MTLHDFLFSLISYQPKIPVGVSRTSGEVALWDWRTSVGLALLGAAGSGKTTALVHIVAPLAATGCRFIVYDPHYPHPQSFAAQAYRFLAPLLVAPVLVEPEQMIPIFNLLPTLSKARIQQPEFPVPSPPIVVIIDEISALLAQLGTIDTSNPLDELVKSLFEVRKMNVRIIVAGQQWTQLGKYTAALRKHLSFLVKRTADTVAWQSVITLDKPLLRQHGLPTNPAQLPVDSAFWQYDCIKTGRLSSTGAHITEQRAKVWQRIYEYAERMTYTDWVTFLSAKGLQRGTYQGYQRWRGLQVHPGGWHTLPFLSRL